MSPNTLSEDLDYEGVLVEITLDNVLDLFEVRDKYNQLKQKLEALGENKSHERQSDSEKLTIESKELLDTIGKLQSRNDELVKTLIIKCRYSEDKNV